MKSKGLRHSVTFAVMGFLILWAMFYMAVRMEGNLPAYSVLNKSPQGYSIYMESLQALGIETRQVRGDFEGQPVPSVQLVAYPWLFDALEPSAAAWVRKGGTVVITAPEPPLRIDGGRLVSEKNAIRVWELGKGRVLTLGAADLTNRMLTKNTVPARNLTAELTALGNRSVLFNEQILFPENGTPSLWKAAPLPLKLLIYQLLLVAGLWFWMKGSRLGKPLLLTAETERTELEYLKAAARFYQETGCWRLMLDIYFRSLLRLMKAKDPDWVQNWERENLPDLEQAKALQLWINSIPPGCTLKEYRKQIMIIEHLKNEIKNRRHIP